jgi:tRNA threonylcarbamoyladenosine biosynthesis protein TsaB
VSGRILAVDTTGETASIALVDQGRLIQEMRLDSPDGFAHILFGAIEQLLEKQAWSLRDIDVFASASGPGSFTGVRVGLAAVKGLAEASARKVIAVSNLQALAWFGTRPLRAVVLDARRGEIYGAVYDARLRVVCQEVVSPFEVWLGTLPAGEIEFITAGYHAAFPGPAIRAPSLLAGAIGKIAASQIETAQDPAAIDANYVRRSDAELLWKE